MHRRQFLKTLAAGTIATTWSGSLFSGLTSTWALPATPGELPWYFVQVQLDGGWDVTLCTDPWIQAKAPNPQDLFLEYNPSEIPVISGIPFGPAMMPLKSFADRLCVVNGLFLNQLDNGHDAALRYMLSGSTNQTWGDLAVEIMETREAGTLGIATNQRVHTGTRNQLTTLLESVEGLRATSGDSFESNENDSNHLSQIEKDLTASVGKFKILHDQLDLFRQQNPGLTDGHRLAALFKSELSNVASLSYFSMLDTHSGHAGAHLSNLTGNFNQVADLLKIFSQVEIRASGQSLLDRTTFYITSEFSRTPALNNAGGKDHNPLLNSAIILGPKIKGGQVFGGSKLIEKSKSKTALPYHIALPVDARTGLVREDRQGTLILRPENVAGTIIESLGISRRRFAPVQEKVPSLANWILK